MQAFCQLNIMILVPVSLLQDIAVISRILLIIRLILIYLFHPTSQKLNLENLTSS